MAQTGAILSPQTTASVTRQLALVSKPVLSNELKTNIAKVKDKVLTIASHRSYYTPKTLTEAFDHIDGKQHRVVTNAGDESFGLSSDEFNEFISACRAINQEFFRAKFTEEEQLVLEEYKLFFMKKMRKHLQYTYETDKVLLSEQNQNELREKLLAIKSQKAILEQSLSEDSTNAELQGQLARLNDEEKPISEKVEEQLTQETPWYSWPSFYLLMVIDFAPMVISGVLYAGTVLEFLPFQLPMAVSVMIGLWLNFTELLLVYSFVAPILKQRLGIAYDIQKCLPTVCLEQIQEAKKINEILSHVNIVNKMSFDEYKAYSIIGLAHNQNVLDRAKTFPEFDESTFSKCSRYVLTAISLAHNAAALIFSSKQFLMMISPGAEVFSPLGILIIAILLMGQLTARYIYRSTSLFVLMNPTGMEYDRTKAALTSFKPREKSQFEEVLMVKTDQEENKWKAKLYEQSKLTSRRDSVSEYGGLFGDTHPGASSFAASIKNGMTHDNTEFSQHRFA